MKMEAPQIPTKTESEPIHDKYVINFAPELVNFIKEKRKIKTYRFGDKYEYLNIGDLVELREYKSNNFIAKAKITNKEHTTFGNLPLELDGHEVYDSKDHQRKVFNGYYKYINREIVDEDPFIIFTFEFV